jgi:spore germination cell wall hydrolase CwlJ-like protein
MRRITPPAASAAALALAVVATVHATPSRAWQIDLPATPAVLVTQAPVTPPTVPPAPSAPQAPRALLPTPAPEAPPVRRSLAEMVAAQASAVPADAEQACLATAVYFEAKGEPLRGQLGVAHVVLNRAHSGRFPRSACAVVRQPGQFSFVRGGRLPHVAHGGAQWRTAVAIAAVALAGDVPTPAPKALFFHARSVAPGWHLTRVAAIGNHVFYR